MDEARLTHVALFVADVERTLAFYREFVGLHVVHDREEHDVRVAWLSEKPADPEFVIVVIGVAPGAVGDPPHMAHLGYDLPSRAAVDGIAARAAEAGCLAEPAHDGGAVVGYFCIVRDPDGNLVEFSHGQSIHPTGEAG
jgi:catechol 2,3-dioxygenase-like lactoylglutathione lyase family enzyme